MDAKQRKCCRCGKPTDVNPKTGKNYVMCHTCREKDSIRKKIAYHTKSEKQGRNKRGTYSAATSGSGLETIYNSAALCIAARNAVSKYVTNFITVLGVEQNWKQRGDRRCL